MEEFLKLDIKKKFYYFMVMAALLLIMVIPVIMATTEKNVESKDIVLDDRWTVTVNDKVYKDVTLSKFRFDMCDKTLVHSVHTAIYIMFLFCHYMIIMEIIKLYLFL